MIHVRHLSHNFGPHWALKDCTFSLEKGDFVFLSGPSGAGKTTLLRLLYAGLPVQRGEAQVAGMNLKELHGGRVALLRRQVGVVFQDFKILPGRTVLQNIALPLEVRGLAVQHIERRVRAVSRALGLEGRLELKCGELSGGEQQRVAIARAFVVNPKVLLADEPTGNLDPELSFRLMELFKQFQAYGATVLFATHSTELMRRHPGAYLMRLEDGMITQANWPGARIFNAPEQKARRAPQPDRAGRDGQSAGAGQGGHGKHDAVGGQGAQKPGRTQNSGRRS
ncbi:ATP-binding cassette domain-containing protein [Desulfovibrio sp. OttesenSCG-928-G11]|nr:ATP-binding cassette domain-containing protein [Desulfovibrio sp. OttesenSCG-928-G11]